jgi:hypothetical protein
MGQGFGYLQVRLLELLRANAKSAQRGGALDTLTLARSIHNREPSRSELVSVRRALATLVRDGYAHRYSGRYSHRHWYAARHVTVRRTRARRGDG